MDKGKCPKCGELYQLERSAEGVGGTYSVFIHKREDRSGRVIVEYKRCVKNEPHDPSLMAGPPVMEDP